MKISIIISACSWVLFAVTAITFTIYPPQNSEASQPPQMRKTAEKTFLNASKTKKTSKASTHLAQSVRIAPQTAVKKSVRALDLGAAKSKNDSAVEQAQCVLEGLQNENLRRARSRKR